MMRTLKTFISMMIFALVLLPWQSYGQQTTQSTFSKSEIEQLVAPIALYPDPLLAQILMASTYPLEIVSASRWLEANPNLKGKALEDALQQQTWDPSVKSLTTVPQVLDMLNQKLDMTQNLGDAFLAQQKDVLDAVQKLRAKAQDAGNLHSSKEQVISTKEEGSNAIVTIESADPEIVYVPVYDPSVIYGSWPYPSYPPYFYSPPGYVASTALLSFGTGLVVGNGLWGVCNWHDGNVGINVNRYNSFNQANINNANWQHDAAHRHDVQYRDLATQQKYGKDQLKGIESRDNFRGRADQGRHDLKRGSEDSVKPKTPSSRSKQNANRKSEKKNLSSQKRPNSGLNNERSPRRSEGMNRGGQTREFSNRGGSNRSSAASRSGRAGGGMERRGGGGRHR